MEVVRFPTEPPVRLDLRVAAALGWIDVHVNVYPVSTKGLDDSENAAVSPPHPPDGNDVNFPICANAARTRRNARQQIDDEYIFAGQRVPVKFMQIFHAQVAVSHPISGADGVAFALFPNARQRLEDRKSVV